MSTFTVGQVQDAAALIGEIKKLDDLHTRLVKYHNPALPITIEGCFKEEGILGGYRKMMLGEHDPELLKAFLASRILDLGSKLAAMGVTGG